MSDAASTSPVKHVYMHVPIVGSAHTPRRNNVNDRRYGAKLVPCRDRENVHDYDCIVFREPKGLEVTCFCSAQYAGVISPVVDSGLLEFVDAEVVVCPVTLAFARLSDGNRAATASANHSRRSRICAISEHSRALKRVN